MSQQDLFDFGLDTNSSSFRVFPATGENVRFYESFFNPNESDDLFRRVDGEVDWQQEQITLYGKTHDLPRETAWYGDANKSYKYSGIEVRSMPWIPSLIEIKERIESECDSKFNSVLLNKYSDGGDHVSWHSDDEPELGVNPVIASVSLGGERLFKLKHKSYKEQKANKIQKDLYSIDVRLNHGSLLIMQGDTQEKWIHNLPKTTKFVAPRINLTFRRIL